MVHASNAPLLVRQTSSPSAADVCMSSNCRHEAMIPKQNDDYSSLTSRKCTDAYTVASWRQGAQPTCSGSRGGVPSHLGGGNCWLPTEPTLFAPLPAACVCAPASAAAAAPPSTRLSAASWASVASGAPLPAEGWVSAVLWGGVLTAVPPTTRILLLHYSDKIL